MNFYEENLKTLSENYPQMDKMIEDAKNGLEQDLEIVEERAYEGEKILKVKKFGKSYYLNGKRNAVEPAKIWVETLGELTVNSPVFIMGVGNWTYIKELVEKTDNKITIVIYEPSLQIFLKFLENISLKKWMEKHLIIFWVKGIKGMDIKTIRELLQRILRFETIPHYRKLILPNYDLLFAEEVVAFIRMIYEIVDGEIVNYATKMRFSDVTVKNLLDNIKYLCDGYKTTQLVEVIPRDIPGIVVAAGPSLNKNIKELKKAKGKAFIIAVDTAIKPLLAEGIIPDMFAIVDGKKPLNLIQKEEAKKIPLVTTINANSDILKYHTGKKFFYDEGIVLVEEILMRGKGLYGGVDTGGSVATNAFSLLYKIGLTRIILVGQDLAFTNNKSHADGTFESIMKEENTEGFIMVEGNLEEEVPTTSTLKIYLDWYNNYIAKILENEEDFRVINATEGGAKIKFAEVKTLREAIAEECTKEVDIQECLEQLSPMLDEEMRKWAMEYLDNIPGKFFKLSKDAKATNDLYGKLDKICSKKNIGKFFL